MFTEKRGPVPFIVRAGHADARGEDPVESTIKQLNRRIKDSEKSWLEGGAEAVLQLRAA